MAKRQKDIQQQTKHYTDNSKGYTTTNKTLHRQLKDIQRQTKHYTDN